MKVQYMEWAGIFILLLYLLFLLAVTCALLVYLYYMFASVISTYFDVPFVPSRHSRAKTMFDLVGNIRDKTILDIGCGSGTLLITAARRGARVIGIERNPLLSYFARARLSLAGYRHTSHIRTGNFEKGVLPHADIVAVYLMPETLKKLRPRFKAELPSHALIVSNQFTIEGWTPHTAENEVYLYRIADAPQ